MKLLCPSCHRNVDPRDCIIVKKSMRGEYLHRFHPDCWHVIENHIGELDAEYKRTLQALSRGQISART